MIDYEVVPIGWVGAIVIIVVIIQLSGMMCHVDTVSEPIGVESVVEVPEVPQLKIAEQGGVRGS